MFDCFEDQKALVTELVNIKSVVGCDGCEQAMAEHLHEKLAGWDYFKAHPENLFLIPTENDTLKRGSVAAVVKGDFGDADAGGDKTRQTVLLMGHIDTVAISDYGKLESLALRPEELRKAFENSADPELAEDARSGRYMFGRGALD
ncbi:MAG: peptidase M20, partial [Firmicutes bacterium]|nr:peptidase M20 [Bacillota bacterium]